MKDMSFNLRNLPSISSMLEDEEVKLRAKELGLPTLLIKSELQEILSGLRQATTLGVSAKKSLDKKALHLFVRELLIKQIERLALMRGRKVINATGILVHTNLGRSPFSQRLWEEVGKRLTGYLNLEYDLELGERSRRGIFVEKLLCELSGAEDALVVNNCAGAVLLILRGLCYRKEVIISRGELVQIGGGFRIPEIMKLSGARLVEVGTTNQTSLPDYEGAITERTCAILKVHKSNFRQIGFVAEVGISELAELARKKKLMLFEDMGSATLIDEKEANKLRLNHPSESLRLGVDAVCFSADKILGLCQGGIILGRKEIIGKLRKSPLFRTLRPDRTSLSLLEEGLALIADRKWLDIPFYKFLAADKKKLETRAHQIAKKLKDKGINVEVVPTMAEIGGGFPGGEIPSFGVAVSAKSFNALVSLNTIAQNLRKFCPPIITKVQKDLLIIDLRTVFEEEDELVAKALAEQTAVR